MVVVSTLYPKKYICGINADSLIKTKDGNKKIKYIDENDHVLSLNVYDNKLYWTPVLKCGIISKGQLFRILYDNKKKYLKLSYNQKIFINNKTSVEASKVLFKINKIVYLNDKNELRFSEINTTVRSVREDLYNIEVYKYNNYFANGVMVLDNKIW